MNIFKVLANGDGRINEPNVSAFLGYLLDPYQDHGLGYEFLDRFLNKVISDFETREYEYEILLEQAFKEIEKENTDNAATAVPNLNGRGKKSIIDIVILCFERNDNNTQESKIHKILGTPKGINNLKHIFLIENKTNPVPVLPEENAKNYDITKANQITLQYKRTLEMLKKLINDMAKDEDKRTLAMLKKLINDKALAINIDNTVLINNGETKEINVEGKIHSIFLTLDEKNARADFEEFLKYDEKNSKKEQKHHFYWKKEGIPDTKPFEKQKFIINDILKKLMLEENAADVKSDQEQLENKKPITFNFLKKLINEVDEADAKPDEMQTEKENPIVYDLLKELIIAENTAEIEPINIYTRQTLIAFLKFIESGFKSQVQEKTEILIVSKGKNKALDFVKEKHETHLTHFEQIQQFLDELITNKDCPLEYQINENGGKIITLTIPSFTPRKPLDEKKFARIEFQKKGVWIEGLNSLKVKKFCEENFKKRKELDENRNLIKVFSNFNNDSLENDCEFLTLCYNELADSQK